MVVLLKKTYFLLVLRNHSINYFRIEWGLIRSVAAGWQILCIFYCCFIFVANDRSPEVLFQLNRGGHTRNFNRPPPHTHTRTRTFDCDNVRYEINSQILYYVIPLGQFFLPLSTSLHKNCETAFLSLFNAMPILRLMHGAEKNSLKYSNNIRQPLLSKS